MLKQAPINMNAQRSIDLIVEALLKLMAHKAFDKISISELTREAGVVRNTFYAHFETKEDVLSYHIFTIFSKGIEERLKSQSVHALDLDLVYFEIWQLEIGFLKKLKDNHLLHLLNQFGDQFDQICMAFGIDNVCSLEGEELKFANAFYADALASVLKKWMILDQGHSPKELSTILKRLMAQSKA